MSDALARILNLLILAAGSVLFVTALADPRIRPPGAAIWLFWVGGPLAVIWTVAFGWHEWDEWRTRRWRRRVGHPQEHLRYEYPDDE